MNLNIGHTGHTAHAGKRITRTNLTTIHPNPKKDTNPAHENRDRLKPRPTQQPQEQPQARSRPLPAADSEEAAPGEPDPVTGTVFLKSGASQMPERFLTSSRPIVSVDWAGPLFRTRDAKGSTAWRFLDELGRASILPAAAVELLEEIDGAARRAATEAAHLKAKGDTQQHRVMQATLAKIDAARNSLVARYGAETCMEAAASRVVPICGSPPRGHSFIRAVAAQLCNEHYAIVDNVLQEDEVSALAQWVRELRSRGELQRGQVAKSERASIRSDLMKWIPAEDEGLLPLQLRRCLHVLDELILGLQGCSLLRGLLSERDLRRWEIQATCYPGGGASYSRHIDNQTGSGARVLTAIMYLNPGWTVEHGGALRVYPKQPDGSMGFGGESWRGYDVEPRHNRLVVFWSDNRVPHEVMPAHAERFAISVWYGDAADIAEAKKADRPITKARP